MDSIRSQTTSAGFPGTSLIAGPNFFTAMFFRLVALSVSDAPQRRQVVNETTSQEIRAAIFSWV